MLLVRISEISHKQNTVPIIIIQLKARVSRRPDPDEKRKVEKENFTEVTHTSI